MLAMLAMLTHGFKDVWTNTWKFDDVWRMSIYDHICLLYVYYMSIMCIRILGNVKPVKLSDLRFSSNLPSVGFQESVPFHPGRSIHEDLDSQLRALVPLPIFTREDPDGFRMHEVP